MRTEHITTTINGYPIEYKVEFHYNSRLLYIFVEELGKEYSVTYPEFEDDLFDYALDQLTEDIEKDLHLWLIDNSDVVYYHSEGFNLLMNGKLHYTCRNEAQATKWALNFNMEEYG